MNAMTKEEFKKKWNNNEDITAQDIDACAKSWGINESLNFARTAFIVNKVFEAAGCESYYKVHNENEDEN